jgi:hypothetical protein
MIKRLQDYRQEVVYNDWVQDAEDALRKNVIAVQWIANFEWYNVLKDYWTNRRDLAMNRLRGMRASDPLEVKGVQCDLNTAIEFIAYLDRMETYTE